MRLLLALATLLTLVIVFFVCLRPIAVTDFWWQAKTGELIVRSGRIPSRDVFSWTAAGNPWVVHEWLTEVLFYWMLEALPRPILLVYKSGLACIACALVLVRAWRRSGSLPFSLGATLLAALVVRNFADLRPQMLTFVLLSGLLLGLDEYRSGRWRFLPWALPPLFILWANLHGAVVVGLILLGLWVAGEWIGSRLLDEPGVGLRALTAGAVASAVAVFLNPNGFHVYAYPFQVLGHPEVQDYISEWFSPNFHDPAYRPFELMLLLLLGAVAQAWRGKESGERIPVGETLVLLAMTHAALIAQRNTAPFALAAAPVIAAGAASVWRALHLGVLRTRMQLPAVRIASAASLCVALAAVAVYQAPRAAPAQWVDRSIGMSTFPAEAVDWMRRGSWPGRLYNDYVWGGYLIWELHPDRPVFIDGRAEVYYPNKVFDDEMKLFRVAPGWQEALRRRGVEVVLTDKKGALAEALRTSPEWKVAFTGKVEAVFTRVPEPGEGKSR